MALRISGLNELRERLERLRAEEVMARALAEQAARMAARVREGLSEPPGGGGHDEPWLRSGALRDSVGAQADGLQAAVGSSDPAAVPQELGTARMPARPFLAPVAAGMGEEVARAVGAAVAAAIRGDGTDGFDPSGVRLVSESGKHPDDPEDVPAEKDLELPGQVHPHAPQLIPKLNSSVPTIPLLGGRGSVPAAPRLVAPNSTPIGRRETQSRLPLEQTSKRWLMAACTQVTLWIECKGAAFRLQRWKRRFSMGERLPATRLARRSISGIMEWWP